VSERPPTGSKAYTIWALARIAREARDLPHGRQAIALLRRAGYLNMSPRKAAKNLSPEDVEDTLKAADRYIADPKNRIDAMANRRSFLE
jgi:hypothetical protein